MHLVHAPRAGRLRWLAAWRGYVSSHVHVHVHVLHSAARACDLVLGTTLRARRGSTAIDRAHFSVTLHVHIRHTMYACMHTNAVKKFLQFFEYSISLFVFEYSIGRQKSNIFKYSTIRFSTISNEKTTSTTNLMKTASKFTPLDKRHIIIC